MISHITYQASRAHLDDLRRQAAKQRTAAEARLRADASPPQITERPHRQPATLRRVLRGLGPRPAAR